MTLRRRGLLVSAKRITAKLYGLTNMLRYAYGGNRLLSVQDQVTTNVLSRSAGYFGGADQLSRRLIGAGR